MTISAHGGAGRIVSGKAASSLSSGEGARSGEGEGVNVCTEIKVGKGSGVDAQDSRLALEGLGLRWDEAQPPVRYAPYRIDDDLDRVVRVVQFALVWGIAGLSHAPSFAVGRSSACISGDVSPFYTTSLAATLA
jgi:hypothetical protein